MKPKPISELLRESDFQKLQHYVVFKNDTSQTELLDYKQIQLIEFDEKSITLHLPKGLCQNGHSLSLFLFTEPPRSNLKIAPNSAKFLNTTEVVGKVTHHCEIDQARSKVVVQCTQYQKEEWYEIIATYLQRQKNINKLLSGHKAKLGI